MATLFDPRVRAAVVARIHSLDADRQPRWGRMNVQQMIVHCAGQLRIALGELDTTPIRTVARFAPLKQLIIYVLPWPKGAPTFRELRAPVTGEWTADRDALLALIERMGTMGPHGAYARHGAFGPLSGRAWGTLALRHLDHHLRQFGA